MNLWIVFVKALTSITLPSRPKGDDHRNHLPHSKRRTTAEGAHAVLVNGSTARYFKQQTPSPSFVGSKPFLGVC
ncbi:hypothetical protein MUK42_35543 [Musa troglodytarum]|uniref:Uncharacterized protein n=1 Tax=Musa troglodytarum TaxID=320322 RepID=A0A9E7JBV0_9LILI|nr:hypothetical protein MUK42_35543 [Musa troglodytarum]